MNRVVRTSVFTTFPLQGRFSFFYFLFFARTKSRKMQNKQFSSCQKFLCALSYLVLACDVFLLFLCARNLFVKKKKFKTALITSFTLLLENSLIEEYSPYLSLWLSKFFVKLCGIVGLKFCNDQSFSLTTVQKKTSINLHKDGCGEPTVATLLLTEDPVKNLRREFYPNSAEE